MGKCRNGATVSAALAAVVVTSCSPLGLFDGSDGGPGSWDADEVKTQLDQTLAVAASYEIRKWEGGRYVAALVTASNRGSRSIRGWVNASGCSWWFRAHADRERVGKPLWRAENQERVCLDQPAELEILPDSSLAFSMTFGYADPLRTLTPGTYYMTALLELSPVGAAEPKVRSRELEAGVLEIPPP